MIDFHSHILPGIDDGAKDIEDSKKIIKEAKDAGVEIIISTSHYALDCFETPEYKRKELINQLKEELDEGDPDLVLGSEIFLTYNALELLEEFKASTIGGTKYILFELPLRGYFNNLKDLLNKIKGSEYKLILAHPERYGMIHSDFKLLYELKELGVLMQCNYGSILGMYGMKAKSTIKRMLKEDLVDFFGSDVHKPETIYPKIPKALKKISKYVDEDRLDDLIHTNAAIILAGEDVQ